MFGLSLEWERCPDGVELVDVDETLAPGLESGSGSKTPGVTLRLQPVYPGRRSLAARGRKGLFIRYATAGRVSVRYDMTRLDDPIVLRFINARDDELLLAFFHTHGFYDESEPVWSEVLDWRRAFEKLVWKAGGTDRTKAIVGVNNTLSKHKGFALTPRLDLATNQKAARLALHPQTLLAYMLMEVAMIPAHNARTTACEHCEKVFLTGPLTDRRSHARYCSDKCRVAAMRKRNAAGV